MCYKASELFNEIPEIYFNEYEKFAKTKRMNREYNHINLLLDTYDYSDSLEKKTDQLM